MISGYDYDYDYGHGDMLHCQKGPYPRAWGHFALLKSPNLWAWGHFALPKRSLCMGIEGYTAAVPDSQDKALYKCRWLLSEDTAFGALPRLKCSPCVVHSVGFVQVGTPNGHGVVFFPSCCKFHCFHTLRGLFLPCGACGTCGTPYGAQM